MSQYLLSKFLLMSVDLTPAEVFKLCLSLVQQRFAPSPVPLFTSPILRQDLASPWYHLLSMRSVPRFPMLSSVGASTFRGQLFLERGPGLPPAVGLLWWRKKFWLQICPTAALKLMYSCLVLTVQTWDGFGLASVRESTFWKYSVRKPWTFHCILDREIEKGDQERSLSLCSGRAETAGSEPLPLQETLQDSALRTSGLALGLLNPAVIQQSQ